MPIRSSKQERSYKKKKKKRYIPKVLGNFGKAVQKRRDLGLACVLFIH